MWWEEIAARQERIYVESRARRRGVLEFRVTEIPIVGRDLRNL